MSDPIQHVVVLMLENHSFDQMLGAFQKVYRELDGIDPAKPHTNTDLNGMVFKQLPHASRTMKLDPHHDLDSVLRQIKAPKAVRG